MGIPNTDKRVQEYNPFPDVWNGSGEQYLTFIIDTVKPIIDRDFRTLPDREHTGTIGSSLGGLISLFAFFQRPDVFGFAGVISPAFWIGNGAIYQYVDQRPFVQGKIYLDNGTREPSARRMKQMLLTKGYRLKQDLLHIVETDGEHNEAAWARRLPDGLAFSAEIRLINAPIGVVRSAADGQNRLNRPATPIKAATGCCARRNPNASGARTAGVYHRCRC